MNSAPAARDGWLAAPRAEALRRVEELELSGGFDWSRVERPSRMRHHLLARALPAAAALTIGLGLALGWALTRDEQPVQPSYRLADVAATAGTAVGEPPTKRHLAALPAAPIPERAVGAREPRRPIPPKMNRVETPKGETEGYAPSVIIVKPPARLPPLFSPEAYRRRR